MRTSEYGNRFAEIGETASQKIAINGQRMSDGQEKKLLHVIAKDNFSTVSVTETYYLLLNLYYYPSCDSS